jgi:hypothetical protein
MRRYISPRSLKIAAACAAVLLTISLLWYAAEPWTLTFIDDGPYGSQPYYGEVAGLRLHSQVELKRFGSVQYVLESRLSEKGNSSVLVLYSGGSGAIWRRLPVKPDGELGPLEFGRSGVTWYGGWRVAIKPAFQEGGYLYLGPLGGFRFFNHSW